MLLFGSYTTSFFLLCVFTLGQNVLSQTGSSCTAGYHCTEQCYSDDCKLKNVALCNSVVASTIKPGFQPACVTVDGITGNDHGCLVTADDDYNPSLRVDLGHTFTIRNMTLYGRSWWFLRMLGIRIYVDDQLCHTIGNESFWPPQAGDPKPIHVLCNQPRIGRFVTLMKNCTGNNTCQQHAFSLCEVQVWEDQDLAANETTRLAVAMAPVYVGAAVAVVIAVNILV
ncbi:uncharacterized protein [Littorina saxatilis]|uniref:Uncharacterized protein n=1 Tax=Littorina saxatilis TaxID=31220 RepID=A0AAN9BB84_9CAEN